MQRSLDPFLTADTATRPSSPVRRDSAQTCRERAAADLLQSVSMINGNERRRMETSAASWTARAELLDRMEATSAKEAAR